MVLKEVVLEVKQSITFFLSLYRYVLRQSIPWHTEKREKNYKNTKHICAEKAQNCKRGAFQGRRTSRFVGIYTKRKKYTYCTYTADGQSVMYLHIILNFRLIRPSSLVS